jgi:hypothetical protein
MRGYGFGNILAGNIEAFKAQQRNESRMNSRWRMCWKCQKDKSPYGGSIKVMDGFGGRLQRFICRDCIEAKLKQLEEKKNDTTVPTVPESEA